MSLAIAQFAFSAFSTLKQHSAEKKAAAEKEEVGRLEAIQYANELFLSKAEASRQSDKRKQDQILNETTNISFLLGKQERSDRSVARILERNKRIAGEDAAEIERAGELTAAKYASQAAISREYGQNSAAGMRAQATSNLLTNVGGLLENMPPSLVEMFKKSKTVSSKDE